MKRVLLVSVGLFFVGGYLGCLPADNGNGTGTAGTHGTAGTTGSTAGTTGSTAGTTGSTAGTDGSTAGTTGSTAGTTGSTAGTTGSTAGTTGSTAGTTGSTAGTTGSTAGTTGSMGGRGGTGAAGTNGRGGMTGAAGTGAAGTNGRGGTTGTAGTTGAGGSLNSVAAVLDGKMFLGPCLRDTQASVCATVTGTCPGANTAGSGLAGVLTTDTMLTLGGTSGTPYSITLHVQGETESKVYNGGTDQNATLASPKADGFRTGGTPTTNDAYNVYRIRVTNPGSATPTDYYLNSMVGPGADNHTTYGMDYTAVIQAQGGAALRLTAADSNCSMIKNCGPTQNDGSTCAMPIIMTGIEPAAVSANPSFNFTTVYNGQWIVLTVKGVTSP